MIGLLQRTVGLGQLHGALGDPGLQLAVEGFQPFLSTLADQQLCIAEWRRTV